MSSRASTRRALLDELRRERRAIAVRVGGEERLIAADEAGLYRDALGVMPPGGLPEAFLADVPDALAELVAPLRTHARAVHDGGAARPLRRRPGAVLRELERAGELGARRAAALEAAEREWCDVQVLRRLRRASLAALRKEIEPPTQRRLAAFLPSWQGVDRHPRAGAGIDRLREVLVPLQGLALPVEIWERDVLPRRTGAYSQTWLDRLCASGEVVWVGAGALGRSGRVALYFREDAPAIGPPSVRAGARAASRRRLARARAAARAPRAGARASSPTCSPSSTRPPRQLREALWDLVWAGEVTNDAWAPLRAPHLALARDRAAAGRRSPAPARASAGRAARAPSRRSRAAGR